MGKWVRVNKELGPTTRGLLLIAVAWTPKVCKIMAFWAVLVALGHYFTYFGGPGSDS